MNQEKLNDNYSLLDSAEVISICDTVISTDSSILHLSGSLGVNTWLALRYIPDWRWGLHKSDTPWYSTLKLFRQPSPDDWGSLGEQIAQQLR